MSEQIDFFTKDLDENKREFILKVFEEYRHIPQSKMLPFLLAVTESAKKKQIQFTDEEISSLLAEFEKTAAPEDGKKIHLLKELLFHNP